MAAAVADINNTRYQVALQQTQSLVDINNENPLKQLAYIDNPLTIKQDQERKTSYE